MKTTVKKKRFLAVAIGAVSATFAVACSDLPSDLISQSESSEAIAPLAADLAPASVISPAGRLLALTTVDFGSSPAGPITNTPRAAGDFVGTEYSSLGLLFTAASGHTLNIGCAGGTGNPNNCLGASVGLGDDFAGTVFATFKLGGVDQVTDQVIIPYVNPRPPPTRTIIRDASGAILLDQAAGNVNFSAPGIASVEMRFTLDAAGTFTFGPLSSPQVIPLVLKQEAISDLDDVKTAILAGAAGVGSIEDAVENLNDAIAFVQASLASFQPGDPDRLIVDPTLPEGTEFFSNEEDAVEEIFDAVDSGEITNSAILAELLNTVVNKILEADGIVVQTAIDDANADPNADPDDIADALAEQATAQGQVAACTLPAFPGEPGPCDDAVGSFEDAWINAQRAVGALVED